MYIYGFIIQLLLITMSGKLSQVQNLTKSIGGRFKLGWRIYIDDWNSKNNGIYLPICSSIFLFFIIPLFLQQLWPFIVIHLNNNQIYIFGTLITGCFWISASNLIMMVIYKKKYPWIEKYRVSKDKPWPWQSNIVEWERLKINNIKVLLVFNLIVNPLLLFAATFFQIKIDLSLNMPSIITIFYQNVFFLFCYDFSFYLSHSFLHKYAYWIHKRHHQYTTTISLSAEYANIFQNICNIFAALFGYTFLCQFTSVHFITVIVWLTFSLIETTAQHSGYQWKWSYKSLIPFSSDSQYHDFHHSENVGNFSALFMIWDLVLETNTPYLKNRFGKEIKKQI